MTIYVITRMPPESYATVVMPTGFKTRGEAIKYIEETLNGIHVDIGWWWKDKRGYTYIIQTVNIEG